MKNIYDIIKEQKIIIDMNIIRYDMEYTNNQFLINESFIVQEGIEGIKKGLAKIVEIIKKCINNIKEIILKIFGFFKKEPDIIKEASDDIKKINMLADKKEEQPKLKEEPKKEEQPKPPKVGEYTILNQNRAMDIKSVKNGNSKKRVDYFGVNTTVANLKELLDICDLRIYLKEPCGSFKKREKIMNDVPGIFNNAIDETLKKFDINEKDVYGKGKNFNASNLFMSIVSMKLFGEKHEFTGSESESSFVSLLKKELGDEITSGSKIDGSTYKKTTNSYYVRQLSDEIIAYCSKSTQFCIDVKKTGKRLIDRLNKLIDELETHNDSLLFQVGNKISSIMLEFFHYITLSTTKMYNTYKKIVKKVVREYADYKKVDYDRVNTNSFKREHTF